MLLFCIDIDKSTKLAVWKMEETESQLLGMLEYPNDVEDVLLEVNNPRRRLEILTTRVLLRSLLGRDVCLKHKKDGAPYIEEMHLNVSISHTLKYVAVFLSSVHKVGVDIECKREKVRRVRHKFISSIEKIDEDRELDSLLLHWSAKECVYKISEVSLPEFSVDIVVRPFKIEADEGVFRAYDTKEYLNYSMNYRITNDFVLVYCYC